MPSEALKSMAEKQGVSLKKAEKYWDEAKKAAKEKGLSGDDMYAYSMVIVKRRLGITENSSLEEIKNRVLARLKR